MANHLEAPREGAWGRPIADADFRIIADAGFRTVRIPVQWSAHAAVQPPYAIDPAFMARVDHVVGKARAAGLGVILNLHNYDALMTEPAANTQRFAGLWRQIAAHFANRDDALWFELLNEPHDKLTNANLLVTLGPALAAVRRTNPTRKVVIGGQNWSNVDSLATLPLPDDRNLVVTFHYYEPFAFTHQGASWVNPSPPVGRTYPMPGDAAALAGDVAKVRAYATRTGRPIFMGEYGAHDPIAIDQRARYYGAVHDAFARIGIDGCAWGYTNGFALRRGDRWIDPILRAIGLGKPR
ncbi:glycoside hydrolase family 5 protein [Sphingomonas sp. EC-HK361]|uniref:glycoside hydrolase family 5 protein n=1 Tax=Sphingomonas sp. EC-HK361 TaxID=2038397 RepID=UPI00125EF6D0|nr:glycoside hydrolase family 5 protein [Sphingomonas sp. EC-HK361]